MGIFNRQTLKNYFKKGGFATEKHFVDLIDSSLNSVDDGISMSPENGLKLNPFGYTSKVISFFKKSTQVNPDYSVELNNDDIPGLSINDSNAQSLLKFKENGSVGVHTNNPTYDFDVRGTTAMESRIGTYKVNTVPGDGNWHDILINLDGVHAFEILASIHGKLNSGRYAIAHAFALSTFGGRSSRSKIRCTSAFYGNYFNKLAFRWNGQMHNYSLQVKTLRHYGIDPVDNLPYKIKYSITKLLSE
jgi:hypothetical protein